MPHRQVDIASIGCDFYAFTGPKMCGPTGTGALWARREHLEAMPPFIGGGEMIKEVRFDGTVFNDVPRKFEAGTPNIAGFAGLGAAVDYLDALGMDNVEAREQELLAHLDEELAKVEGLRVYGTAPGKAAVVSFLVEGAHAHDLATLLDIEGVAIRSGQNCAHPLLQWFGIGATCRASLAFYNTHEEIEVFVAALRKVRGLLARGPPKGTPPQPSPAFAGEGAKLAASAAPARAGFETIRTTMTEPAFRNATDPRTEERRVGQ